MREAFAVTRQFENVEKAKNALQTPGAIVVSGCIDAQKSHLCELLSEGKKYRIYVTALENKSREALGNYRFYDDAAVFYPARDFLFFQADVRGDEIGRQRMICYRAIDEEEHLTIFTTPDAFMDGISEKKEIREEVLTLSTGDVIDPTELEERLTYMGYERAYQVDGPGTFAIRGGIVDIYPLTQELAYRLEFFDDEIDSVRSIDPESQRSIEMTDTVTVYPFEKRRVDGTASFLSYFDPKDTIIFVDEIRACVERARSVEEEVTDSRENRVGRNSEVPEWRFFAEADLQKMFADFPIVLFQATDTPVSEIPVKETVSFPARETLHYRNNFDLLVSDLKKYKKQGARVLFVSTSRSRAERFSSELMQENLNSFYTSDPDHEIKAGEVMLTVGHVKQGFEYPGGGFVLITDGDVFETKKRKRKKKAASYDGEKISSFSDLHVGDYVVHENHGLGIYRGIEQVKVEGMMRDYLKIEYAKGGVLYVQVTQLDLIQKYTGAQGANVKLNSLGGTGWKKTKAKVQSSVDEIATELVELYAARQMKDGFVYGPDTVWQREFEESFPYEETDDQVNAIEAVKHDMESTKIMDRLVCGDVGFGKTEVAIRAAFKAVQENKQVAYLVPTTILAQQHYNTFVERMKEYPVHVDLLCRFRSASEQRHTVQALRKGAVDIVIGTHRLLSSDVIFKDLGLLIIDEEQRFGVNHKEKIKQIKNDVDVLSLTATPIPRTLHMSLIGIRDMSLLKEAPQDRQAVQTFVTEYDAEIVREAIGRELKRNGQVYYVYNHVRSIPEKAHAIERLVPEARVAYAHGQMDETQLEDIMYSFIRGEIDVLVSTTIVETGLDISNVNTMIIEEADRMGLSQLYQLRGRVGRSDRLAYAFFMYKKDKILKEVAEKRLTAIRDYSELGSGMRIAMRDLEIRGAGNLLGKRQSGNMSAVGYDLYCKMLNEAVLAKKGVAQEESFETTIDLPLDAYIPDKYISDEFSKLDIYKRISQIEDEHDREEMTDELIDRFGEMPKSVEILMYAAQTRTVAHEVYITKVTETSNRIRLDLFEGAKIDLAALMEFLSHYPHKLYFKPNPAPHFEYVASKRAGTVDSLRELIDLFEDMKTHILENHKEVQT